MFEPLEEHGSSYDRGEILEQLESLLIFDDRSSLGRISSLANASALLFWYLSDINWLGFYLIDDQGSKDVLTLGPFQGAPACVSIAKGKGVCGTAWERKETLVVPDVSCFPGHIACDAASKSEVVVPLIAGGSVVGVLDVDSPVPRRFSNGDVDFLEKAAALASRVFPYNTKGQPQ